MDDYFAAIDNPKSIYQLKALAGDFDNIPGVKVGQFSSVANNIAEMADDLIRTVDGKAFTLKDWHPTTFVKNTNLAPRAGVEVLETLDNGIELVRVTSGTKMYRVFDGFGPYPTTSPKGSFWTFEKPTVVEDVIGGTAVQPDWNGMVKIIEIEAPSQGIIVWRGKAARQPLSSNYNIQNRYLDGGVEQVIFDINSNQVNLPGAQL